MSAQHPDDKPILYESHPVETRDGYELQLYRSRPGLACRAGILPPVLLLPGANSNRLTFGVTRGQTLPDALNAVGRDVWMLDFRGCRSSRYLGCGEPTINLDVKMREDLPAAVANILSMTGHTQVDLIGHSLGGVFTYAFCARDHAGVVRRATTIASPAHFSRFFGKAAGVMHLPTKWLAPAAKHIRAIAMNRAARLPRPIATLGAMRNHIYLDSMSATCRRRWLHGAIEGLPGGDLGQLMRWITTGQFVEADGAPPDWSMSDVFTPTLMLCASGDRLIDPGAIIDAHRRLGASDKQLRVIGRAHGATRDYRHADVLLAPAAVHDVYPHIIEWLGREAVTEMTVQRAQDSKGETSPAQWA